MLKTWSENKKLILLLFLVGIIAFRISSTILNAFFTGEDEATYIPDPGGTFFGLKYSWVISSFNSILQGWINLFTWPVFTSLHFWEH